MNISKDIAHFVRQRSAGYKTTYLFVAVLAFIFELLIYAVSDSIAHSSLLVLSVLLIFLALAPWLGLLGDAIYIVLYLIGSLLPIAQEISFPILGIGVIAITWIISNHALAAGILILGVHCISMWGSANFPLLVVSAGTFCGCTFALGLPLRKVIDKEKRAQQMIAAIEEESQKRIDSMRDELAAQLHDTVAKDLAQVTIALENLAISHPSISEDLSSIANIARTASHAIHPMIMDLATASDSPSLVRAVKEAEVMLRSKNIVLAVEINSDIDRFLSAQALLTSSLFVREASTNILKYGEKDSTASLFIECENNDVSLMMVNKIATQGTVTELAGGYGLVKMRSRIENEGGKVAFIADEDRWIINASIPNICMNLKGEKRG